MDGQEGARLAGSGWPSVATRSTAMVAPFVSLSSWPLKGLPTSWRLSSTSRTSRKVVVVGHQDQQRREDQQNRQMGRSSPPISQRRDGGPVTDLEILAEMSLLVLMSVGQ